MCFLVRAIDKLHLKSEILDSFLPTFFFFFFIKIFALKMGSSFKEGIFDEAMGSTLKIWAKPRRWGKSKERGGSSPAEASQTQMHKMARESQQNAQISEQAMVVIEEITTTSVSSELPSVAQPPFPSS